MVTFQVVWTAQGKEYIDADSEEEAKAKFKDMIKSGELEYYTYIEYMLYDHKELERQRRKKVD